MLEHIVLVASLLPTISGKVSHNLTVPSIRHLHYLTLARFPILQYCCKLLLLAIKVISFFLIYMIGISEYTSDYDSRKIFPYLEMSETWLLDMHWS